MNIHLTLFLGQLHYPLIQEVFHHYILLSELVLEALAKRDNVRAICDTKIDALVTGDGALKGVAISSRTTGETQTVACDGLFVAIGLIPENGAFASLAALDKAGYFDADERCLTGTPGVFVAGDCRAKGVRQLTTAVADGATAALAACRYLNEGA